jgi:hypothetical protein
MIVDGAKMRRVRRKYVRRAAAWLEADRERIYQLTERMRELGLYAPTTAECDIRSGIISTLAKVNGHETPTLRHRWMLKTGWVAYWGWSASPRRRAKGLKRAGVA